MATEWQAYTKSVLRSEMVRRRVGYTALVDLLADIGIAENEANLRNKISRGTFSAQFMLQCLVAMGATRLTLQE